MYQKLCNKRALSTGEPCTCEYVTLLQSQRYISIHWYIAQTFQLTFSMSVSFRCSFKTATFSRFLKAAIARSKMQEKQSFLWKKISVSLEKDYIFRLHIYFSASFATITMFSFNIETLNSGGNSQLKNLFIKVDVAIATFKNLLKITVFKENLNKTDKEKVG